MARVSDHLLPAPLYGRGHRFAHYPGCGNWRERSTGFSVSFTLSE